MKRFASLLLILSVMISGAVFMTGCDNDDDDKNKDNEGAAAAVAGTYHGTLAAKVMTVDCSFDGEYDLVIRSEKESDDATVVLPACTFTMPGNPNPQTIHELTVSGVDVEKATGAYLLEDDDFNLTVEGVAYSGRLEGTVKGSDVTLNYTVTPGKMPMPINFTFTGTLKK